MKKALTLIILFVLCSHVHAQSGMPKYPLVFELKCPSNDIRDTSLTNFQLDKWVTSANFPSVLKWKNTSYSLKKDGQHMLGLYTDSMSHYNDDDIIGYAYFKISSSGTFRFDYKLSNIGRYINDSASPNVELQMTSQGIIMKADGYIAPGTELTVKYEDLMNMFPHDPTIEFINY